MIQYNAQFSARGVRIIARHPSGHDEFVTFPMTSADAAMLAGNITAAAAGMAELERLAAETQHMKDKLS